MSRILVIDNYDSFTYNLVQLLAEMDAEIVVHRNDEVTINACLSMDITHLLVSPGPGRPESAGISMALMAACLGRIPILGVCLGHQCLAQLLGGTVGRAPTLMHGKSASIHHDECGLYAGLSNPFQAGRYHSLVVEEETLPACLTITAYSSDGQIMGVRHREHQAEGVQFHPESLLTPRGGVLLRNFLHQRERLRGVA